MRDKDASTAIAALLRALRTLYPREKNRVANAPELCGVALTVAQEMAALQQEAAFQKDLRTRIEQGLNEPKYLF